ncbi:MAG TPA: serine/threonine-protein kinase, partial [Kofleriaceae bacterium]|nr:serine/threonine-protein kinase [Kofleriaceae bacterium]
MVVSAWSPPAEFEEYRIVRLLGSGAMGQVYLAHDSLLDRLVAVKFVHAPDPAARARFFEEARAIARLQHPNVVAIYRIAEIARHPYLVTEYVRGRTLDQLELPVPWRQVLDLALDLARGLAAAHRCGVLHRDVKPANAMFTEEGHGKLLDFGLARIMDGAPDDEPAGASLQDRPGTRARPRGRLVALDATLSAEATGEEVVWDDPVNAGLVEALAASDLERGSADHLAVHASHPGVAWPAASGTPLYMAPEVWRGDPATRRSDLYSLGIMLYEMLSGRAPHRGIPMANLGNVVQGSDIPRLGDVAPGIDPTLAAIVDRLVERDAGARFASADELLVALEECATPPPKDALLDGNPYRGLAAFDSAHGTLFFGRRREIRELVDRVRTEPFVVVGGDSGIGKSSLCRA